MRKTKSEGKTVGISQSVRKVANFAMQFANHIANFAMRKFANHIAKFAMRNFAKDSDAFVRQMNSVLWLQNFRNAKFAMRSWQSTFRNAKWLPTDCQLFAKIPALLFLF